MWKSISVAFLGLVFWTQAAATVLSPSVEGNTFSATIQTAGVSADLTIRFENVVGLTVENLGLSVQQVGPMALAGRLPSANMNLPAAFPLMLRIDPPVSGGLSFEGVVEVELYTQDLQYTAGSPLRLFTAPAPNGNFHDITDLTAGGSYRTRSSGGHFSDFIILADHRPPGQAISAKFDHLDDLLTAYAGDIPAGLYDDLGDLVDDALTAWQTHEPGTAMQHLEAFDAAVKAGTLPNVWRAARDLDNVGGELRAAARTLRYSLSLAANL